MFGEWPYPACYRHGCCDDPHRSNIGKKTSIAIAPVSEVIERPGSGKHIAVEVGTRAAIKIAFDLLSDQRGAVAFEMPIVWLFLMMSLLLPLADVAIAGFQFISAWEALRAFGQSIQYDPPPDVTNASGWTSSKLATQADPRFPISKIFNSFAAIVPAPQATRFAQVLFIHDDRHLVADGVKIGVV